MEYETGNCNYVVVWKVHYHVSGTELLGRQELMGEYESEAVAEAALIAAGFSQPDNAGGFWRKSYTHGYTTRVVEYDFN